MPILGSGRDIVMCKHNEDCTESELILADRHVYWFS